MSLPSTVNDFKPVYNLVELKLENYKENELVLDTIYELKLFFQNPNNCTCYQIPKQKDLRTCFEKLCRINNYLLCTLQNYLQLNGLTERVYRNTGRASKTDSRVFLDLAIIFLIKQFLVQYRTIHRFSSLLRHQDNSSIFIYLLTGQIYVSVYNEYKKNFYLTHNKSEKIILYFIFRKL
ncbi:13426_t:CDS:2 [Dentiscutata heterogama]|uniref:13426_t:CDS:1 n=1 Tax=Dentiscutata heterogama TaxID=1316150 RepID=A0ACA9KVR9_9GLOM|nr:13426_t:CDS:2 [Dentiscutata heterogama]